MIDISDLSFTYPNHAAPVFDRFTWRVERGERWAVIGASGCGKSTLLHLLVGVRQPNAGAIAIDGASVPRKKNRGKTGLVLQDYGLLPWATVRENAELGLRIRAFYGQGDARPGNTSVGFWMERLGIAHLREKFPAQISGGQRQRAAIARTLALEPDVLLMDEPFAALDALTREDLERLTLELHAETRTTLIFVTHNIEEAVLIGGKILVLGAPPNRDAATLDNPYARVDVNRAAPEFQAQCRAVRARLKAHAQA